MSNRNHILPAPQPGQQAAVAWVAENLAGLFAGQPGASPAFRGGQREADRRLAGFDVTGYAERRNEVWPEGRRGASRLSPYIRHGLISLPSLWRHVGGGPARDVAKYRDELLWQEYARHVYARLGQAAARRSRYAVTPRRRSEGAGRSTAWPRDMACLDIARKELETDGWLPNQQRMWLASQWSVRRGLGWREGEELFFRHLLDGSRAANRLGWAWTVGAGTGKPYGFARWQVEKRAPGLCRSCPVNAACPIESWPDAAAPTMRPDPDPRWRHDPDPQATAGPSEPVVAAQPEAVWLTAESLGDDDPAAVAHRDVPVHFVFDDPLLRTLSLASARLVFLTETLADLAQRREVVIHVGRPVEALSGLRLAATFTPTPGWRARAGRLDPVALYPWPWLFRPHAGSIGSYTAWRRAAG